MGAIPNLFGLVAVEHAAAADPQQAHPNQP
jgi:hypothetical protein